MKVTIEVIARRVRQEEIIRPGLAVRPGEVVLSLDDGSLVPIGRGPFERALAAAGQAFTFDQHGFYQEADEPQYVYAGPPEQSAPDAPVEAQTVDVSEFHTGGGWYLINGEKVRGEDAAREALRASGGSE